jgi:hypothetical protein
MRIKKRTLKIIGLLFVLAIVSLIVFVYLNKSPYRFEKDFFSYSTHRPKPLYEMLLKSHNATFDIYSIKYRSRPFLDQETTIYALLLLPKEGTSIPGLVLLPGGGITKEGELNHAAVIANLGYAVLVIDQRGLGQTLGTYLNPQQDYAYFTQGKEPIQHLSVYDALAAYDVLRSIKNIDKANIALAGLSMGGRYAIIAAALDKRIKGVIGIATSGFHVKEDMSVAFNSYALSIDPDHYVDRISPNYLFMFHGTNDKNIPIESARSTFDLAKEPKRFFVAQGCDHGYCDKMYGNLTSSLKEMFGR